MGLFSDLFSNKPAKDAALYSSLGREAGLKQATGTLNTGYGEAQQYLDKIPGYLDTAKGYLESAKEPLSTASARFDPLASTAGAGFDKYASLFGVGGGDPTAAVRAMPGYQFSQDEGSEQALRAALGNVGVGSGNALQSVFDRGANIADTKWQQYAAGLLPFLELAPRIAGAQGGYDVAASGLEAQKGGYEAQKGQYATGSAGLETDLAKTLAQYQTGTANANSDAMASAELARGAAAKNAFDAIMGGAKLAVGAFTGGSFGAPSPAANFMNMFSGKTA